MEIYTYNNLKNSELKTVDDELWRIYAKNMNQYHNHQLYYKENGPRVIYFVE